MLKIFNKLKKNFYNVNCATPIKNNKAGIPRHYPPANKEWFNSIYAYNFNTIKLLPTMDKVILRFIKSYFNLYSRKLENKVRFNKFRTRFIRFRRLSINRILISKAELKHTSEKVIITIYIYNRQKKYYLNKLKTIKTLLKIFFKKCLYKEILSLYFYQILSLNKSKFKHSYIFHLTNLIETFYKKKVDYNLVILKYLYLNSYIFTQTVVTKLRNKYNKLIRVLIKSLFKFTVPAIDLLAMYEEMYNKKRKIQNLTISDFLEINNNRGKNPHDSLDFILYKMYTEKEKLFFKNLQLVKNYNNNYMVNNVTNIVLRFIKHKSVSGIRLEAAGRLTRRYRADKSVYKVRYKGNLRNIDSSLKKLSSVLLRGHAKSGLQHTKLKSWRRIGSFGIKGWVNSN
uniref:Ribosomal protein S3 n=1 Tax=Leptogium corticola TaxID=586073 RepID=A0A8K1SP87_9LECA|nr:ribosomal protein S3 [Leptogium corticola]